MPRAVYTLEDAICGIAADGLRRDWVARHKLWETRACTPAAKAALQGMLPPDLYLHGTAGPVAAGGTVVLRNGRAVEDRWLEAAPAAPKRPRIFLRQSCLDNFIQRAPAAVGGHA